MPILSIKIVISTYTIASIDKLTKPIYFSALYKFCIVNVQIVFHLQYQPPLIKFMSVKTSKIV